MKLNTIKCKKAIIHIFSGIFIFLIYLKPTNFLDLGWHLRYGQEFFKYFDINSLTNINSFSNIFTNYHWINHSWGYDIFLYLIYKYLGFIGITIISALIAVIIFTTLKEYIFDNQRYLIILITLFYIFTNQIFANGLKSQIVSVLFFSIIVYLANHLSKQKRPHKKYFIIIGIMSIIWANMHGQFILGIGFLILYLIGDYLNQIHKKSNIIHNQTIFTIIFISVSSSLINIYGYKSFIEPFTYLHYKYLNLISEWTPVTTSSIYFYGLNIFTILIIFNIYKKYKLNKTIDFKIILTSIVFGYFAYSYKRMLPFYFITGIRSFKFKNSDVFIENNFKKLLIYTIILIIIASIIFISKKHFIIKNWNQYCNSKIELRCSPESVDFINKHKNFGKIFNYYNWGGYLEYQTNKKYYIDGRMHLWKLGNYSPFYNYNQIYFVHDNFEDIFNKENFDTVIIQSGIPLEKYLITKPKWKIVYRDKYASIISRNKIIEISD